jgi:hypothetical protein
MENIRILTLQVTSSTLIIATFTHNLDPNIDSSNVVILADSINVPDPQILQVKISSNEMRITTQPLTPFASYFITFKSSNILFKSINGDALLIEDGVANKQFFLGPMEPDNVVKEFLTNYLRNNIYNLDDNTTIVSSTIQALSLILSKALYAIRQLKNENYLSFTVNDELKTRSAGPFDRLNEEGAYKVLRVGRTPFGTKANKEKSHNIFPFYPVTLKSVSITEVLFPYSDDKIGKFNINNLVLNLSKKPITKVNSIVFNLSSGPNLTYTYPIEKLGYRIHSSKYDQEFGFSYDILDTNQILLNETILSDANFSLNNITSVQVSYEYKNHGIIIDASSINVSTVLVSSREVIPPLVNIFHLNHAPIVNSSGDIVKTGGITFIDTNNSIDHTHKAFLYEIPFTLSNIPSRPGEYSVDYSTGTVYVYGADSLNDGTGPFPPVVTYNYKHFYENEIDYVYDEAEDEGDLVALPNGSLINNAGTVRFSYEEVLIPGQDYEANVHKEELSERIENRLLALNILRTKKSPITNVFRIYNETSGEIYGVTRWDDNKIYFKYKNAPRILTAKRERANFANQINEILFVNTSTSHLVGKIFKILLKNNNIIAQTEDSLGSSINTSIRFSNPNVFVNEKWFNREETISENTNRLTQFGDYCIDYLNGVIYCYVSNVQNIEIGSISYKYKKISPNNPHVITVNDIYYQFNENVPKNKTFSYSSFDEGEIIPKTIDFSDEISKYNELLYPYQIKDSEIGIFTTSGFIPGVTDSIKFVRSIYEFDSLKNDINPINFVLGATFSGNIINVYPLNNIEYEFVQHDGTNYFVNIPEKFNYLSPNININISIIRQSDGYELWDNFGTIVPGNPVKLILSGINSPSVGDAVLVNYTFMIKNLSRVVVDYNKGDYFIDYNYLADEIVVSYEYGDNVLDFRTGNSLNVGDNYYVSYKVGALRDALLKNFGTLIDIEHLNTFDIDLDRERYRDALMAALESFIQGPTISAIKNIGYKISHIEPEVIESIFQNWSLGKSLLNPRSIETKGKFSILPAHHGNGVLINNVDQKITFPLNSNLKFESGSFETWLIPEWDGIDNNSELIFSVLRDGYIMKSNKIFIGALEYHPEYNDGLFKLTKFSNVFGTPNTNKDGLYIYYDKDISGKFNRWYVKVVDGYTDGYLHGPANYVINIKSNGIFYDTKSIVYPMPSNMKTITGINSLTIKINGGDPISQGITFICDKEHYILDFGEEIAKNRLSLFKDPSGYFNFRVYDKFKNPYYISADVSSWKAHEKHHVAISWKLNTKNSRDEMHLFIDGFEVPNIIKYGNKLSPYLHEKYRTINPEQIIGVANKDIVGSNDLVTVQGSNIVTSSINFGSFNISIGDTIFIEEPGFSNTGYTIILINGNHLTLNVPMPISISAAKFSINKQQFVVTSEIDIYPNIAVSTISKLFEASDLIVTDGYNTITAITNFITQGVEPGYLIVIDHQSFPSVYTILNVSNHSLVINTTSTISASGLSYRIYPNKEVEIPGVRALKPAYNISKDGYFNNIITLLNTVKSKDLLTIKTLGLNFRKIKKRYYVWGDNVENIIMTRLPPPISLDEADITRIIIPSSLVGPSNSTLLSGIFYSNNIIGAKTSNSQSGRTLSVNIAGTNIDFSIPVEVTITGQVGFYTLTETVLFNEVGTKFTTNKFLSVDYINVKCKPIYTSKNCLTIEVKEKYRITKPEDGAHAPLVRYAYQMRAGSHLQSAGYDVVKDGYQVFSSLDVGNHLIIHSPPSVAGFYKIKGISSDFHSLTIVPTIPSFSLPLPSFTGGTYEILNTTEHRTGLQNGFFTFEQDLLVGEPYLLEKGWYEFNYNTYLICKIDPIMKDAFIGSDFNGNNHIDAIINELKITSNMMTDTRIGENIGEKERSITKDFNSLKQLKKDINTLMLVSFDSYPFINMADYYINYGDKSHVQADVSVNDKFSKSVYITDKPIILQNSGILDTKKEGTIEFWISPIHDTANDPHVRFYFDASSAVIEESTSENNSIVRINGKASKILSVKTINNPNIDYFAGGSLELDYSGAITENVISLNIGSTKVSNDILQVISVKIVNDLSETDYFDGGSIDKDKRTIYLSKPLPSSPLNLKVTYKTIKSNLNMINNQIIKLGRRLPNHKTKVLVTYIPKGLQGDRISIFKDKSGYINFNVHASNIDYLVRAPIYWEKNSWHRIKASYKFNGNKNSDEIRLFIDGYERGNVLFGTNFLFGQPHVYGSSFAGNTNIIRSIKFKDNINTLFIGSQFTKESAAYCLIDNLRISNISRPIYAPYGESLDINYNKNINVVLPVTEDLYTTYLMNFETLLSKNEDFILLKNKKSGIFDFSVNIFDSFGIINNNSKIQAILEALIKALKPANSRVFIKYIK